MALNKIQLQKITKLSRFYKCLPMPILNKNANSPMPITQQTSIICQSGIDIDWLLVGRLRELKSVLVPEVENS